MARMNTSRASRSFAFLLILGLCTACGSTSVRPTVLKNEDMFADNSALDEKADELTEADIKGIEILPGLPDGIAGANGAFSSQEKGAYQIVGRVTTMPNGEFGGFMSTHTTPLYFYPYADDESWRRTYCHIQVPLTWVTLGIWSLVPTYYPCWTVDTNKDSDIANRKKRLRLALLKGAKALGGDTVVFLDSSGTKTMNFVGTQIGNSPMMMGTASESSIEWTKASALVLKKK